MKTVDDYIRRKPPGFVQVRAGLATTVPQPQPGTIRERILSTDAGGATNKETPGITTGTGRVIIPEMRNAVLPGPRDGVLDGLIVSSVLKEPGSDFNADPESFSPVDRDSWSSASGLVKGGAQPTTYLAAPYAGAFLSKIASSPSVLTVPSSKGGDAQFGLNLPDKSLIEGLEILVGGIMPETTMLSQTEWSRSASATVFRTRISDPLEEQLQIAHTEITGPQLDAQVPGFKYRRVVYKTPASSSQILRFGLLNQVNLAEHAYHLRIRITSSYKIPSWTFLVPGKPGGPHPMAVPALGDRGYLRPFLPGVGSAPPRMAGIPTDIPVAPIDSSVEQANLVYYDPATGERFKARLIRSDEFVYGASQGMVVFAVRIWLK